MTKRRRCLETAALTGAIVGLLTIGTGCDTDTLGDGLGNKGNSACLDCHTENGSLKEETETADGGMAGTPASVDQGHTIHRRLLIGCETCHVKPKKVSDDGHLTGLPADVTLSGDAALGGLTPRYNVQTRRCEGTYCHGGGMVGGTNNAPSFWDITGEGLGCDSCHGNNPAMSAAHPVHYNAGIGCNQCHKVPINVTDDGHIDGPPADIVFGPKAEQADAVPTWDPEARTCSGTYCHGATLPVAGSNKTPMWTATGNPSASCDSCHGNPSPETHIETATDCYMCHPSTVNEDNSINWEGGYHLNGEIDF